MSDYVGYAGSQLTLYCRSYHREIWDLARLESRIAAASIVARKYIPNPDSIVEQ